MTNTNLKKLAIVSGFLFYFEIAQAAFWPLGKALQKVIKTTNAEKKDVKLGKDPTDLVEVYSALGNSKSTQVGVVVKGIYPPNCTHTWVIGVDKKTAKVSGIYVVEMSCPHAHPTNTPSYLNQYTGVGPADLKSLDTKVVTVAKATGSSELTTDAVKKAVNAVKTIYGRK